MSTAPKVYRLVGPYTKGPLKGVNSPFEILMEAHIRAYSGHVAGKRVALAWKELGVQKPDGFTTDSGNYGVQAFWDNRPALDTSVFTKPTRINNGGPQFVSRLRGPSAVKKVNREKWEALKSVYHSEFDKVYGAAIALNDIAGIDLLEYIIGGYKYRLAMDYQAREVYVEVHGADISYCGTEPATYAKFGELQDKKDVTESLVLKEVKAYLRQIRPEWQEDLK